MNETTEIVVTKSVTIGGVAGAGRSAGQEAPEGCMCHILEHRGFAALQPRPPDGALPEPFPSGRTSRPGRRCLGLMVLVPNRSASVRLTPTQYHRLYEMGVIPERTELMSLFRGSCLARLSLEAGASSAVRSRAGALERELTASFQAAWSIASKGAFGWT